MIKNPPEEEELMDLAGKAGVSPLDLVNKKSEAYKELDVDLSSLDDREIIKTLINHPKAIRRPIITDGNTAVLGFEEEKIQGAFS